MDSQLPQGLRFDVSYPVPVFGARNTHWNWKGLGELLVSADEITLTGQRRRPFWFARPQSITIRPGQVRDVVHEGCDLDCVVDLEGRIQEPLKLRFESAEDAGKAALLLPATRSTQHQETLAFTQELAKSGRRAFVTPVLIGICVLVFIALATQGIAMVAPDGRAMIAWGTNYGPLTLTGQLWRLFTAMFLHFGLLHIAVNMWSLWSLGQLVEKLLGSARFATLYLLAGLGGSIASVAWNPDVNSAGASGAIFGVMGALVALMLNPRARIPPTVAKAQRNSSLAFIAFNVFNGLTHQGIDNAAHMGGLMTGFALGWLLAVPLGAAPDRGNDRRLMATVAIALLTLGGALSWVMHPGPEEAERRHLVAGLQKLFERESLATSRMSDLARQFETGEIAQAQWAERSLSDVLPLWEQVDASAISLEQAATGTNRSTISLLRKYTHLRRLQTELRAKEILKNDNERSLWTSTDDKALARYTEEAREALKALAR